MTNPHSVDTTPLVAPLTKADKQSAQYQSVPLLNGFGIVSIVILSIITIIALSFAVTRHAGPTMFVLFPWIFVFVGGMGILGVFAMAARHRRTAYRLSQFAYRNNMTYIDRQPDGRNNGLIFGVGNNRQTTQVLATNEQMSCEFAKYSYTTGSGKEQTTHEWLFVRIPLPYPLPNIVLDAKSNNSLGSNLPRSFARNQRLSLEGDFDRYFTLYCPEGYERDALYLFTPDVMQNFMSAVGAFDVEIIDNNIYLYSQARAARTDPALWIWQFNAVATVRAKLHQWARWRDDRLAQQAAQFAAVTPGTDQTGTAAGMVAPQFFAAPGVAPQGRRLKQSIPWFTIVIFAIVIGGFILMSRPG